MTQTKARAIHEHFERYGFVAIRGALRPDLAEKLRDFVVQTLQRSLEASASGEKQDGELFGATAPVDGGYSSASFHGTPNRWNVLLSMEEPLRNAFADLLDRKHLPILNQVLELCFPGAALDRVLLCDLMALVSGIGSQGQRLHYDTRFSDDEAESDTVESSDSEDLCCEHFGYFNSRRTLSTWSEQHEDRFTHEPQISSSTPQSGDAASEPRRLVQALVALQDIEPDMGPTLLVPRTNTARVHRRIQESSYGSKEHQDEVLNEFERRGVLCTPLRVGDLVLMDSRTLHKGTANLSASGTQRVLLDFAFMDPEAEPSTYCGCILAALDERRLRLRDVAEWSRSGQE